VAKQSGLDRALNAYLGAVATLAQRGDAREESYYPALKDMLEALASLQGESVHITVLPKPTEAGNPDFRVWDGARQVIGYIEAKPPGANLDSAEDSEQLHRYRSTFPNLILTDFYEFRLYRDGVRVARAALPRPSPAQRSSVKPSAAEVDALGQLLTTFFAFALPPALTAEELARQLARRTRFLREQVVLPELREQLAQQRGALYGFYDAFQKYLIAGLTAEQFADLYAQTVAYGLFAARTRTQQAFNRQVAFAQIPPTIGILRDIFQFLSLGKPSPQMEVIVDDIAAVLDAANLHAILHRYFAQGKGDDPILHFYETFLAEYDPETRERRGVYYTPQPVVRYIVRAVHDLLQTRFAMPDGLADPRVTLLDPAAGTLTFPAEAVQLAFREFTRKYGHGAVDALVRQHILPHFYAFELLMAPYAIGHMKIGFLLESLGAPLRDGERFQLYLTNALERDDLHGTAIPGLASLAEESHHAARIKNEAPILVILGNPPYSGISANQNDWTETLLKTDLDGAQNYYTVDGTPLGEKNPKWLQDDYVKFLRFAQWKIHRAGRGIVAMITNHGYLDNPTFRGMRQSLLKTFDEIYILDLHGNSLKRETAPDGSPDENVFDIRQGVAIGIFVKYGENRSSAPPAAGSGGWQTPVPVWQALKPLVRELRTSPTPAEHALWQRLRGKQLGVKFRRQHTIGPFIVDFYAGDARLIIEVDGPVHEAQKEYDAMRQACLESLGYRVLRFTNAQVLREMDTVLAIVRAALVAPHPLPPSPQAVAPHPLPPSPQAGKGNPPSPPAGRGQGGGVFSHGQGGGVFSHGQGGGVGAVYHADLYGKRADKYHWLENHTLQTAGYQRIEPIAPFYFFTPRRTENLDAYQSWPSVTEIFPLNSVGIVTARDKLCIQWTPEEMWATMLKFSQLSEEEAREAFQLGKDARDWKVSLAQQDVKRDGGPHRNKIVPILYRPFDVRYTYYTGRSRGFHCMPRPEVMRHMLDGENLSLIAPKQHKEDFGAFITNHIGGHKTVVAYDINYYFPLYCYPSTESGSLLERERRPNLAEWLLPRLRETYGFEPTPESVLAYLYAVFYSPTYRQKYAQELRTDFPRVPFTADGALFRQMAGLGQRLIALHLLDSHELHPPAARYEGAGSDLIERVQYDPARQRVALNKDKYFEGITPAMWQYRIGGYPVLEKYLKDRKGRMMDDPVRYIHIATAIARTIDLQQAIDALYPAVELNALAW
jgi:very-short-patch-repair endonuclease